MICVDTTTTIFFCAKIWGSDPSQHGLSSSVEREGSYVMRERPRALIDQSKNSKRRMLHVPPYLQAIFLYPELKNPRSFFGVDHSFLVFIFENDE